MTEITPTDVFNNMSDRDLEAVWKANKLKELCLALSLDLNSQNNEKSNTYEA